MSEDLVDDVDLEAVETLGEPTSEGAAEPVEVTAEPIVITVEERAHGWRVDHYLTRLYSNFSRAAFQRVIGEGLVTVNGEKTKMSRRVYPGDTVQFQLPTAPDATLPAEDIPIDVLYEDDAIIVINKAAGMIVHPGKGNYRGTLAGALQFHFDKLSDVAGKLRAGIVHRLDRDTTGVLVVAKDNAVHGNLSSQFEARTVEKEYRAIAWGEISFDRDFIETHVRVSNRNRERMMVCQPGGNSRHSSTFYDVLERFHGFSFVRLCPQTGRTHQLRVHLHHLRHPIVADRLYEGHSNLKLSDLVENLPPEEEQIIIDRQCLHALSLAFDHPVTGERMKFEAPLPEDFQRALAAVRQHRTKTPVKKK